MMLSLIPPWEQSMPMGSTVSTTDYSSFDCVVGSVMEQLWQFEFDEALAPEFEFKGSPIDGDSTLTSLALIASLETLATGHCDAKTNLIPVHLASAGPPFCGWG